MKAWLNHDHGEMLRCEDVADPQAGESGLVIRVTHCGLCHSDLHRWHGISDLGSRGVVRRPRPEHPIAMGHEIVGEIIAMGPEVKGRSLGEKVIVYPWFGCGKCKACMSGQDNLCREPTRSLGFGNHGGFAEKVAVPHERYAVPLAELSPEHAAPLACAGLTVRCAIRKLEPFDADQPIVLIGAGGVGLTAISVLHALGHRNIISLDRDAGRGAAARAAGASHFIATPEGITTADVLHRLEGKVDAILDFVNSSVTATMAFELLGKGGRMVQVGLYGGEMKLPLLLLTGGALTVQGSITGTLDDLRDVVTLARDGKLPPIPVSVVPRADVNDALRRLDAGTVTGRLVLEAGQI
ncbi:alcohol dehydrogenase/propanol-preferring alcohol dehydrogenase [Neorhizobium galegae]|uniref:alcohol dehydrogenase catalytic domain-containing protein n=1 Tax=Neorhizobium galegae TaxID=399 RepID=UPI001AE99077|nr:alcohol dehydrogenase catalytic domain-containing protein [Neorhizobium galegae]MBP2561128.1 alcohol dehydrogenase/propanol-preferring alcohol dehydrogenase [Neorhizobium galegae]MDQ0134125.1 alcohol dehydrogenase/propanol-preferring alcohol dehydrogenase [Neorhizobium galegae]